MRIITISNMYPTEKNPVRGIFVKRMLCGLSYMGLDVEAKVVLGLSNHDGYFKKLILYLRFFKEAARAAANAEPEDIVLVQFPTLSGIPMIFAGPLSSRVVFNFHGTDVLPTTIIGRILFAFMKKYLMRYCNDAIFPSDFLLKKASQKLGLNHTNAIISPSGGYDAQIFSPGCRSSHSGRVCIAFISRISKEKGIFIFLNIIQLIIEKCSSNIDFRIQGSGEDEEEVMAELRRRDLLDVVDIRFRSAELSSSTFADVDVLVMPSLLSESLGLVGIEALACGVPVVASDGCGYATYIDNGVNGFLAPKGNIERFADAIIAIIEMPLTARKALRERAIKSVESFERRNVSERLVKDLLR